ncbi:MAG: GNAT family N-acetyltransferase [Actinomycetota bacterium]|nr:GNAT family N-acetyltransferase [Actinomycetota bacterium]MDP3629337.1 GNAT family N-acetyltransferase [Actinomycetota bacterium]
MARKFRPLTSDILPDLPAGCSGCVFWESVAVQPIQCGLSCDPALAKRWIDDVSSEWGECGRVVVEDGEILGFIKYAPARLVPQARLMPAGAPDPDAVLIACMHIAPEARQRGLGKVLLQAALRDLTTRGERTVQSYATTRRGEYALSPVVGVEFLLRMGFTVVRPHPELPLMQLDLRSLVSWTENLEAVLESLRLPLRVPRGAPVPNIREKSS